MTLNARYHSQTK